MFLYSIDLTSIFVIAILYRTFTHNFLSPCFYHSAKTQRLSSLQKYD
ncbi:hypothetical protein PTRA_a2880 [Pseudoalteromonas translucida KMM 520]|uniref:Uncharacterized protein n=1 Tax=Pseudoalteromonas translucida KMM 520 TaxID=1315283 RepID=A0A0U2X557_9GAMM|nr:hypothetical protein PTRA_a2880 [Pseudoalteromonas translucida KMM 520]